LFCFEACRDSLVKIVNKESKKKNETKIIREKNQNQNQNKNQISNLERDFYGKKKSD